MLTSDVREVDGYSRYSTTGCLFALTFNTRNYDNSFSISHSTPAPLSWLLTVWLDSKPMTPRERYQVSNRYQRWWRYLAWSTVKPRKCTWVHVLSPVNLIQSSIALRLVFAKCSVKSRAQTRRKHKPYNAGRSLNQKMQDFESASGCSRYQQPSWTKQKLHCTNGYL